MKNDFKPVVEHRFNLRADWGAVDCRVVEVEPNKTLSYTWAAYGLESVVTWTPHPYEHRDPPAHGAVGLPAGSAAGLPGRQGRVAEVLCKPGTGIGADGLKAPGHFKAEWTKRMPASCGWCGGAKDMRESATTKGEPPSRLIDAKIKELDGWRGNGLAPIDNDVLERDIRPFVVAELGRRSALTPLHDPGRSHGHRAVDVSPARAREKEASAESDAGLPMGWRAAPPRFCGAGSRGACAAGTGIAHCRGDRRRHSGRRQFLRRPSIQSIENAAESRSLSWSRPVRDSNPCYQRERLVSWASRRTGQQGAALGSSPRAAG